MRGSNRDRIRYDRTEIEGKNIHIHVDLNSDPRYRYDYDYESQGLGSVGFLFLLLTALVIFVGSYGGPDTYAVPDFDLSPILRQSTSK
ncbi:MAG: hypothetical protein P5702_06840 [Limnospira sp. PMC 1291.21]|nr:MULTISPECIES: hypothetical protein [Limnospira]EKD08290.1 hypothetical protein SPLC1_S260620 [Arthrospira platensis C1]MDT9177175.1 hypothetical protein [Limnospira sp. PMC 1238.20]MDT9192400.1 hypothetical protein [Limnospira sp. PMC 1245.20]MDT9197529.1 hypothetical protein [Limnospira sp. PMC 1042.18]MDT9202758.1 hypothetical protein [Limnospira sp. PMC 1243.20]